MDGFSERDYVGHSVINPLLSSWLGVRSLVFIFRARLDSLDRGMTNGGISDRGMFWAGGMVGQRYLTTHITKGYGTCAVEISRSCLGFA